MQNLGRNHKNKKVQIKKYDDGINNFHLEIKKMEESIDNEEKEILQNEKELADL